MASFIAGFAVGVAAGERAGMPVERAQTLGLWCGVAAMAVVFVLFVLFRLSRSRTPGE